MAIPTSITLEDVDGNEVPMVVIGTGNVDHEGEQRTYLALVPEEAPEGEEEIALVVRWIEPDEIVAIEDDAEFRVALDALEMEAR